jgi:hypothetical protein
MGLLVRHVRRLVCGLLSCSLDMSDMQKQPEPSSTTYRTGGSSNYGARSSVGWSPPHSRWMERRTLIGRRDPRRILIGPNALRCLSALTRVRVMPRSDASMGESTHRRLSCPEI